MLRKVLILTAIVLVFAASHLKAAQIPCSWVGCDDGLWGDPTNWSCGMVPDNNETNTFVVIIDTSGCPNEVTIVLQQYRTIDKLDCYGKVVLQQWGPGGRGHAKLILEDVYGLVNHGYLKIREYDININGNVTNIDGAMLSLVDMHIEGNLYNQAGATVEIGEEFRIKSKFTVGGGNLENTGTILVVSPDGEFSTEGHFKNLGTILIYGGVCGAHYEILDNNSTGLIRGFGILHGKQLLRNKGQIIAFGGSLAVGIDGDVINEGVLANYPLASLHIKPSLYTEPAVDVNNLGTIEVNAGGGVTFDCNLVNEPNGIIKLLGGTLAATSITQSADANFAGFGSITGDILIESGAKIELAGPTNIVGDVNIPTGATLEISDGQTLITGHTTCDGTIHLIGGTVVFQGGCDCEDCNIINEAGIDRNHFDLNADGIEDFKDFAYFAEIWLWQASWY